MTNAPKQSPRATVEQLLAIPEAQRHHEIVDGVLVEKEAATGKHGGAQVRLSRKLGPYDRRPGGRSPGGWWFATEVEIQLASDQVFRPDVAGWRRERMAVLPSEVPIMIRPDWVCEILSQNKRNDLIKKKRAYHRSEVGHYWIVDPIEETLAVYRWHSDGYVEIIMAAREERIRAEPFEGLELHVGVLFGDDEEE
jgi:Uma2 family endonuclease